MVLIILIIKRIKGNIKMYCKYCGNEIKENSIICAQCGNIIDELNKVELEKNCHKFKPIKCPNCKSKELAFLPYTDKEKPFLLIYSVTLLIVGVMVIVFLIAVLNTTISQVNFTNINVILLISSIILLFFIIGLRVKQPYKSYQRIQFICKNCGHHGIIYSEQDNKRYNIKDLKK